MANSVHLGQEEVIRRIGMALEKGQPFSLVRIGDGENLVLSQNTIMSMDEILQEPWVIKANQGHKGVKLPNISLRNLLVRSIRRASIVGLLPPGDQIIQAPTYLKRELTNKILAHYQIHPTHTCPAWINRQLAQNPRFWAMLHGRRIMLMYQSIAQLKSVLQNDPYRMQVTLTFPFVQYGQMTEALQFMIRNRDKFDVALICCGVNAVVLAQKVAELTGKVGIDFGKASNILIKGKPN